MARACPACRSLARRPASVSPEESWSSLGASRLPAGSPGTRSRSIFGRSAGRPWSGRPRASTWASPRLQGRCTRSAGERPASTRIFCTSSRIGRVRSGGRGSRRCPIRAAAPALPLFSGTSCRRAARSRQGRSRRCSPTASQTGAGSASTTSPHPATASGWRRSAAASSSSGAGREPGLTVSSANEALRIGG